MHSYFKQDKIMASGKNDLCCFYRKYCDLFNMPNVVQVYGDFLLNDVPWELPNSENIQNKY